MSTRENISRIYLIKRGQTEHRAVKQQYMLEYRLNKEPTIDALNLALTGEVWGVYCKFFGHKMASYKEFTMEKQFITAVVHISVLKLPTDTRPCVGPIRGGAQIAYQDKSSRNTKCFEAWVYETNRPTKIHMPLNSCVPGTNMLQFAWCFPSI